MPIAIEPAAPGDFAAVEALLVSSGLPLDGLREHFGQALVARLDGRVIGSAALERYGHVEGLVNASPDKVKSKLTDYTNYAQLAGPKFKAIKKNIFGEI
ncbi:MAG TPA: hypothetical protein PKK15_19335, partial [Kouleothrix sp.]|nr:hypothetical protein [Kouleothrix sp.]